MNEKAPHERYYMKLLLEGVEFENSIIETSIKHIERLLVGTTSSINSDFRAGNRTKLETLTGIVVELGKKYNSETPVYYRCTKI